MFKFFSSIKELYAAALGIEILCIAAAEINENTSPDKQSRNSNKYIDYCLFEGLIENIIINKKGYDIYAIIWN